MKNCRHALSERAFRLVFVAQEYFSHRPKQTKHKEDAHKRRQTCDGAEERHKHQAANANNKHRHTLTMAERRLGEIHIVLNYAQLSFEFELQQECRYDYRYKRRQEHFLNHTYRRDVALDPKHDGRYVANRRESTAAVGGKDDERGIDKPVVALLHEFAEHHNHHDARGQIVEHGRENKGNQHDAPQQRTLASGAQTVAHEDKATVGVDSLDNGHRSHQEE